MGRSVDPTYSSEQRAAIAKAVNADQLEPVDVAHRARTGELSPDLEPFDVPVKTVADIAYQQLPGRTRITASPRVVKLAEDILDILDQQTAIVARKAQSNASRKDGLEYKHINQLTGVAKVLERLVNVDRLMKTGSPGSKTPQEPLPAGRQVSPLLRQMAADMDGDADGEA